jgi:hypothetical protein
MSPGLFVFVFVLTLTVFSYIGIGLLFDYFWRLSDINGWLVFRNILCWPVMIVLFHRHKVGEVIERIKHNA